MARRAALLEVVGEEEVRARFEAEARRIGVSALARLAGVSTTNVYQALKGGALGIAIPLALGYAQVRGFQRVGVAHTAEVPDQPLERRRPKYGPKGWAPQAALPPDAVTDPAELEAVWDSIDPTAAVPHVRPVAESTSGANGVEPTRLPNGPYGLGDGARSAVDAAKPKARPVPVPIPIAEAAGAEDDE